MRMLHLLRCKSLSRCFINIPLEDVTIQSLLHLLKRYPSRECHCCTNPTIPSAPLIQYLQTSLGFSPERALRTFKQLKSQNPGSPDAIVKFLRSHGLSQTHIQSIIDRVPSLLFYSSPESSIQPKILFLKDKGVSDADIADLLASIPSFFTRSVEGHIKPVLDVLRGFLGTDESAVKFLIRKRVIVRPDIISTNLTTLRNCGVLNHHIPKSLKRQPKVLNANLDRFNEVVEMVRGMGFKPQSSMFVEAVFTIVGLSQKKWDAKFKVYASLGWSHEETVLLFRKQPVCMRLSEGKIRKGFNYLTKEMGWVPSYILVYPTMLFLSLEKRIIPRHRFLQFLASKGLVKNNDKCASSFLLAERKFFENFVMRYESKVPNIQNIYKTLIV